MGANHARQFFKIGNINPCGVRTHPDPSWSNLRIPFVCLYVSRVWIPPWCNCQYILLLGSRLSSSIEFVSMSPRACESRAPILSVCKYQFTWCLGGRWSLLIDVLCICSGCESCRWIKVGGNYQYIWKLGARLPSLIEFVFTFRCGCESWAPILQTWTYQSMWCQGAHRSFVIELAYTFCLSIWVARVNSSMV